jgi:nicotinamide-nucleotide amidase
VRLNQLEEEILQRDHLRVFFYAYGDDNSLVKTVATLLEEKKQSLGILENGTGGLLQAELSLALAGQPYYSGGKIISQLGTESGGLSEEASRIREELQADLGLVVSVAVKPESTVDNVLAKVYLALASTSGISKKEVDLGGYSWQYLRQLACLQALDFVRNTL